MTKMITCVSVLQLYEKCMFSMDDEISLCLPEFKKMKIAKESETPSGEDVVSGRTMGKSVKREVSGYAQNPIIIKHLFTMSAGFDYDLNSDGIKKAIAKGKNSTRDIVDAMAEKPLGFEPGTHFRFSLCHDILGALIEVWSGQKLGDYMQENIFKPLEMKETFFGLPKDEKRLSRMAARYSFDEERNVVRQPLECPYNITSEYESGGAGLASCATDYALFVDTMANGGVGKSGARILSAETIRMMSKNHLNEQQMKDFELLNKMGYGYGLGVRTHLDKVASGSKSPLGEFGWDGAAGALAIVDAENKLSFTYFQYIHNSKQEWHNGIRNALYSCFEE